MAHQEPDEHKFSVHLQGKKIEYEKKKKIENEIQIFILWNEILQSNYLYSNSVIQRFCYA